MHTKENWFSPIFPNRAQDFARDKWIGEVAMLLAAAHGDRSPNENLVGWAVSMAENMYDDPEDRITPADAVDEELSYF